MAIRSHGRQFAIVIGASKRTLKKARALLILLIRVVLGAILIAAGVAKIGHFGRFATEIAAFRLLPQPVIAPLAVLLPFVEVLVGIALLLRILPNAASWTAVVLFAGYDAAVASAAARGMSVDCGCFGPNDASTTSWGEAARDALFLVLALLVACAGSSRFGRIAARTPESTFKT